MTTYSHRRTQGNKIDRKIQTLKQTPPTKLVDCILDAENIFFKWREKRHEGDPPLQPFLIRKTLCFEGNFDLLTIQGNYTHKTHDACPQ